MQGVLKEVSDDRVRAYIVWVPMLAADSERAAQYAPASLPMTG